MSFRRAAVFAILPLSAPALAGDLIFADILNLTDPNGNSIRRVHDDGTGLVTLIATGGGIRGLDLDAANNYIYWTDVDNFVIRRGHLDGTGQQDLITSGLAFPAAIRLTLVEHRLFWGDGTNEEMDRANLDGTGPQLMATTPFYRGLAVDDVNLVVYWTTSLTATTGQILKSDFIGNSQMLVLAPQGATFKPGSLALDVPGGKMYWTDQPGRAVRRANLDGSDVQTIYDASLVGPPKGIALDLGAGLVYFGQDVDSGEGPVTGQIYRMNLDGAGVQLVADNLGSVNDLIFVPAAQSCYANCDNSTQAPILNANDFQCFLNNFAAGSSYANCDHSTQAPILNANDFQCFLNAYAAGCT